MKKYKLLSILLAGAVVFSSVPTGLVFAAPSDDILSAESSDGQDIIRSGEDDIDITAGSVEEYVSADDKGAGQDGVSINDMVLRGD
ncbi:MAG: hypothetical protein K5857_01930, partial [Lachnospiraceae bacterium]|nr:hypothetical protein [Lachnospiraceae bacterium]